MLNKNSPPWRAEIATRVPIWHVAMQHFRTLPAQGPKTTSVPFMLCPVDRVAMRPGGGALMRRIGLAAMGSILIAPAAGRAAEFQPYAEGKLQYDGNLFRSEEHTSELQSLMRISYAVFCLKKKNIKKHSNQSNTTNKLTTSNQTITPTRIHITNITLASNEN